MIRLIMEDVQDYRNNIDRNAPGGSFVVSRLVYVGQQINLTVKVRDRDSSGTVCTANLIPLLEKL